MRTFYAIGILLLTSFAIQAASQTSAELSKRLKQAILLQQLERESAGSRATASRLVANSFYYSGQRQDSSWFIYNNNYPNYDMGNFLTDAVLGGVWKYDSVENFENSINLTSTSKRTYSNEVLVNEIYRDNNVTARYSYMYDGQGRINMLSLDTLAGANWSSTLYQVRAVFTGAGLIDSTISAERGVSGLVETEIEKYTYTANQKVATVLIYSSQSGSWTLNRKTVNAYDGLERLIKNVNYYTDTAPLDQLDSTLTTYPSATLMLDTIYMADLNGLTGGQAMHTEKSATGKPLMIVYTGYYDLTLMAWVDNTVLDSSTYLYNSFDQEIYANEYDNESYLYYETYNDASAVAPVYENLTATLYPNPAQQQLNIELPQVENGTMIIRVMNLNGQTMMQTAQPAMDKTNIDIRALPAGVYLVQVTQQNKMYKASFVKE